MFLADVEMANLRHRSLSTLPRDTKPESLNIWDLVTPAAWTKMSGGMDSLYRSTDGGQTWSVFQEGVPIGRLYALVVAGDKNAMVAQSRNATWSFDTPGYADANDTQLVVTSDGGHIWKIIKPAL